MVRELITTLALSASAAPAAGEEFYIARDPQIGRCIVVAQTAAAPDLMAIGDSVFRTRADAEAAIPAIDLCTN